MTAKTFEEKLSENPDSFDSMDCRPGPANLSKEYSDSITPDHLKELRAKRALKAAAASKPQGGTGR